MEFQDFTLSGIDVKGYLLFRREYVKDIVSGKDSVSTPSGTEVNLGNQWIAYELGMMKTIQYKEQMDVKDVNSMTSRVANGIAKGRSILNGRMVFRNTAVDTLSDLKRRILNDENYAIDVIDGTFGVGFEDEIKADEVYEEDVLSADDVGWEQMPYFDILLVASDERDIELPRVMRFKDIKISSSGASDSATDTEDNEFCNYMALGSYTPWRTMK